MDARFIWGNIYSAGNNEQGLPWWMFYTNSTESQGLRYKSYCLRYNSSYKIYAAIFLHSSAHFLQASAHSLQCLFSFPPHSAAHASHSSTQMRHNSLAVCPPMLITCAAAQHKTAHSLQSWMHRAIISTSCPCRQLAAQWLQIAAHCKQASMQILYSDDNLP